MYYIRVENNNNVVSLIYDHGSWVNYELYMDGSNPWELKIQEDGGFIVYFVPRPLK